MTGTNDDWDYCQLEFQVQDDELAPNCMGSGHEMKWAQFLARASGRDSSYLAGRSERIPLPNMLGATPILQQNNMGHRNVLQLFIEALQNDGWELLEYQGSEWWERRLRRPADRNKSHSGWSLRDLLTLCVIIAGIVLIAYLLYMELRTPVSFHLHSEPISIRMGCLDANCLGTRSIL